MELVAHQIQGSAVPGESMALQWHGHLLQYGVSNLYLWDTVAMMASHLIILDKCPGVWSIGIGDARHQILCEVLLWPLV